MKTAQTHIVTVYRKSEEGKLVQVAPDKIAVVAAVVACARKIAGLNGFDKQPEKLWSQSNGRWMTHAFLVG